MSKRKILQRGKKKKKAKRTPLRNGNSIGGTQGVSKKKPMKSFESKVIREGKAPRDRKKRMAAKADAQSQLKSINNAQKQKPTTKKPLQKRQPPTKKPSLMKKATTAVKKAVSNTMRKGMQMLKKMAKPTPKKAKPARVMKRSKPKR